MSEDEDRLIEDESCDVSLRDELQNWKRWSIIILFALFNVNMSYQVYLQQKIDYFIIGQPCLKVFYVQMFMFQSIYSLVADFYNVSGNEAIWLGQMSLVTLSLVLFPSAFLSDFVSVRFVVIASSAMVVIGTLMKTAAALPLQSAGESNRVLFPLLFTGQGKCHFSEITHAS